MEVIDMKFSKFIITGLVTTLVASPILFTSTTVSATQTESISIEDISENVDPIKNNPQKNNVSAEEINENITNFEIVSQSNTEIIYNHSKNNINYQTVEKIDLEAGQVESIIYEKNESGEYKEVSVIKSELNDNSLYQEGSFYGEEFTQNIELEEVVQNTEELSIDNHITPFMNSNWEYLKTFKTSTYVKGLSIGAIALAISRVIDYIPNVYAKISAYLIDVAALAYSMTLTYVYNSEEVYRIFDYSTPVPTIKGERVIIKQFSNSSRTKLLGQKTVYYSPN